MISEHTRISEIIELSPACAGILDKYDIDYGLHGDMLLNEAGKLSTDEARDLAAKLDQCAKSDNICSGMATWDVQFVCDFLSKSINAKLIQNADKLDAVAKRLTTHRDVNSELSMEMHAFVSEVLSHLRKEQRMLYPRMRQVSDIASDAAAEIAPFGRLSSPVKVLRFEHEQLCTKANMIHKSLLELTENQACIETVKRSEELCRNLKYSLRLHCHIENRILFPKAISAENKLLRKKSFLITKKQK